MKVSIFKKKSKHFNIDYNENKIFWNILSPTDYMYATVKIKCP